MRSFSSRFRPSFIILAAVVLAMAGVSGVDARVYYVSAGGGLATLTGGESPHFYPRGTYGFSLGFDLNSSWRISAGLHRYDLYTDSTISSSFDFGGSQENAVMRFKGTRLGLTMDREIWELLYRLRLRGGITAGLLIWKNVDPVEDTVLSVLGSRNETLDFSSTEIFVGVQLGIRVLLAPKWSIEIGATADYLTGAGTDFADEVGSARDRWLVGMHGSLVFSFGLGGDEADSWVSDDRWREATVTPRQPVKGLDSDGDGVPDSDDNCNDTPQGVTVDRNGCAVDSDADGIVDGRDHCPNTDIRARGMVDIYGCPVDSDFDGVSDYVDVCPNNAEGAEVDSVGCPKDDDADGVPNGLDDCPNTLFGIDVDRYGCIDLGIFDEPMVLNIDYAPGSFEVDPNSRDRLERLARLLLVVPDIRLEVNGYTDNIGTSPVNKELSQKRANRVRDYLVAEGIDTNRIEVNGRGETNFIASNDTAEGRGKNRRIEIVFYK